MVVLPPVPHRSRARRRLAGGLTAAAAALLAAPAAGQAAPWTDSAGFTTGANAYNIHLAPQPDGSATAAWLSVPGSTTTAAAHAPAQLFVQHADGAGNTTTPTQLAAIAPVGSDDGDPSPVASSVVIAPGPAGSSVVAWSFPKTQTTEGITVAFVSAAGAVTRQLDVATSTTSATRVALGVDGRGIATLAYNDGTQVVAAHIAPDGTTTTTAVGGDRDSALPSVGVAPDGIAWVVWNTSGDPQAARLDADGALASGPQSFSATPTTLLTVTVAPDGSGAVVGASESSSKEVVGARLAPTGPVVGSPFHTAPPSDSTAALSGVAPALALSPDGTVVAAQTITTSRGYSTLVERFAPGAASGAPLDVFEGVGVPLFPGIEAGGDGRVAFAWTSLTGIRNPVRLRVMGADGSLGPVVQAGDVANYPVDQAMPALFSSGLLPFFTARGDVQLGVLDDFPNAPGTVRVQALDDTPPAVALTAPASGTVGVPVSLGATATDRYGIAGLAWDFGDGSGATGPSVSHTYGAPGTYPIRVTVTDGPGNTAVVTRALTISAAPPSAVVTAPPPPPRAPALNAAKLVITKATRSGRHVTITGTIARSASGKVTIAYTQKVGGATVTQRKATKISKGRFTVTLTVPSAVLKARTAATVAVTYAGDADTLKGTAKHVVSKAKSTKKKKKKKKAKH
jgi:PKD repeat protein